MTARYEKNRFNPVPFIFYYLHYFFYHCIELFMSFHVLLQAERDQGITFPSQMGTATGLAKNSFSGPAAPGKLQKQLNNCCFLVFIS